MYTNICYIFRYSKKSAKRIGHKARLHAFKRKQIQEGIELMVTSCPNLSKVNLVVPYKIPVVEDTHGSVWEPLLPVGLGHHEVRKCEESVGGGGTQAAEADRGV